MYDASAQGVDEHMINVHYYYYYLLQSSALSPCSPLTIVVEPILDSVHTPNVNHGVNLW